MLESLIITLREGIEIALVIGILIVYLTKIQRTSLIRSVYVGLALAVLVSIAGAFVIQQVAFDQESIEGYFLLVAAVFVISMIVWMWRTAKRIRSEIEQRVSSIMNRSASWEVRAGIVAFTFLVIAREGVETVIFLQAVSLSTGAWQSLFGTVAGIMLATVFATLFIRGSLSVDIGRFMKVTAIALLIFTLQLLANAFHEFYEYGVLPASPKMMGILGPIVRQNVLFIIAIMSIPAFMLIIPGRKKQEELSMPQRRWQLAGGIGSLALIFFLGAGEIFSSDREMDLSSKWLSVPPSGVLSIPTSDASDGSLHRYSIRDAGLEIRFFVLRTGLAQFVTAFDACRACYSYGRYYTKEGELVCSLCDAPTSLMQIRQTAFDEPVDENNSGSMEENGCAPIYLPSRIGSSSIEIRLVDLQKQRKYFDITQGEE